MSIIPDKSNIPETYNELDQDELKLLLHYNQYCLQIANTEVIKQYYQDKIDYISSLIKR